MTQEVTIRIGPAQDTPSAGSAAAAGLPVPDAAQAAGGRPAEQATGMPVPAPPGQLAQAGPGGLPMPQPPEQLGIGAAPAAQPPVPAAPERFAAVGAPAGLPEPADPNQLAAASGAKPAKRPGKAKR